MKVYLVNYDPWDDDNYDYLTTPNDWTNEKFIEKAELVYTLEQFTEMFNSEETIANDYIRFI